ncbi:MAG: MBL fold metallo-hydrolase [Desulfocapsa sp.]|nr:MBL fold metallo-hydrolase [Desulfocapsa sp.]
MKRAYLLLLSVFFVGSCTHKNPYFNPDKSHHTESGFQNVYKSFDKSLGDLWRWRTERWAKDIRGGEDYSFPLLQPDIEGLNQVSASPRVTWIGHATLLVQWQGKNILTDPHFSERASPVSWAGPKRVVPPAIKVRELPPIDVIIISHDHYDSLDTDSVRQLSLHHPQAKFFVPLGIGRWLVNKGIPEAQVEEMDWWEKRMFKGLTVTATPVQHWGRRSLWNTNENLWAGWAVKGEGFNFFFVGDSGYAPHFKEIGEKLGPFDLAAIPIGAYEPRWFMSFAHMDPGESVRVHQDLRAKRSVAMHWGTFILTDEPLDEPPKELVEHLEKAHLQSGEFFVLKHGETRQL